MYVLNGLMVPKDHCMQMPDANPDRDPDPESGYSKEVSLSFCIFIF